MRSHPSLLLAMVAISISVFPATEVRSQGAPDSLSFQGLVTDPGGIPIDTPSVAVVFKLYRNGSPIWEETHPSVEIVDGVFSVLLGGTTRLDTLAFDAPFELGITVGVDPEISPRTPLTSAAYAKAMPGMYTFYRDDGLNNSGYNVVGGFEGNFVAAGVTGATISGGGGVSLGILPVPNSVLGRWGTVGGGFNNSSQGPLSTVGGGTTNVASGDFATVGGGGLNTAAGGASTVGGGSGNTATGPNATVAGGVGNTANLGDAAVAGGRDNTAGGSAFVGGGRDNSASGLWSTVGGGRDNSASGDSSTVGGGSDHTASGPRSTIGGGRNNTASGRAAIVGGGSDNTASGSRSTVSGGWFNTASGFISTVTGGWSNTASGYLSTVSGGMFNGAVGGYSFAAGRRAIALHGGTFVWADSTLSGDDPFVSTGVDQFLIRASGGVGIGTNAPANQLTVNGSVDISDSLGIGTSSPATPFALNAGLGGQDVGITQGQIGLSHTMELTTADSDGDQATRLLFRGDNDPADVEFYRGARGSESLTLFIEGVNGRIGLGTNSPAHPLVVGTGGSDGNGAYVTAGGTWTSTSSRALKDDLQPVDPRVILEAVGDLPLYRWRYKGSDEGEHMGPVAEDFFEAFELGGSAQHISAVDGDGVALAAIQGLYAMVLEQRDEIERLRRAIEDR